MLMLGDIMARLSQPEIAVGVLKSIDPEIAAEIVRRAEIHNMRPADFVAGALREFVDRADDDHWAQLMTYIRKAEDPGLTAVEVILGWVANS